MTPNPRTPDMAETTNTTASEELAMLDGGMLGGEKLEALPVRGAGEAVSASDEARAREVLAAHVKVPVADLDFCLSGERDAVILAMLAFACSPIDRAFALLREQHEAMADVMMLRRPSSNFRQRELADKAIVVWRRVQAFLATPTDSRALASDKGNER